MKHVFLISTCAATLSFVASPAIAQSQATQMDAGVPAKPQPQPVLADGQGTQAAADASPAQQGIADIVVTANRREENLQRAPIAITAISGDALKEAGVTKPTELTALVPALQVATSAGPYSLFYIRGVGNFNGNALSDSAIAFNSNGVYVGRPSSTTGFFYDLQRVEVLKGPQGTLYGRNATGGAINVISHAPDLNATEASASAEYGNYNALRLDGMINVPIGDSVALRGAGIYVKHDGYLSDGTDDQKDWGGRLTLLAEPASNLKVTIYGDYFNQGGKGPGSTVIALGPENRIGLLSTQAQAFYQSSPVSIAGRNFNGLTAYPYMDNQYFGVSSTIEWRVPIGTITFVPAYREGHLNFVSTTPGFQIAQREVDKQSSFEARLTSPDGKPLSYLFGLFYYDEENDVPTYDVNSQYNAAYQAFDAKTRSMAVFGRLGYAVTSRLRVSVGARYTTEDKTFAGTDVSANRLCINFPAFQAGMGVQISGPCTGAAAFPYNSRTVPAALVPFSPAYPPLGFNEIYGPTAIFQAVSTINSDERASFDKITYRLGADWQITDRNLLYASYETGFKSGGFFFSADNGVYKPENIKAYTVGSKNRFFNNRLQLNLEGYWWDYSNQQISHLGQDSAGNIIFPTENVGKARFRGFEVETQFLLTRNTLLRADVQYLDAVYQQFSYNVPLQGPPPANGCALAGASATQYQFDCSGLRPPNAPKWTLNLGAQQTIPLGNSGKVVLDARAHYQTETLTGLEFLPIETQKAYWLADAQITFTAPESRFFIGGFINNLFNETVLGNTFPPPLSNFIVGSLRPPRTYGVRAGVKF